MTIRCMRIGCWIPKVKTHTQNMQFLFLFHCNNGFTNAHLLYAIFTLPAFLKSALKSSRRKVQANRVKMNGIY